MVVRCRPLSEKEKQEKEIKVVKVNCERGTIQLHRPPVTPPSSQANGNEDNVKIYTFDTVYDCDSKQEEIYADVCHPLVESVLNGFNGTIFAYGQTGTGKTYTMEGLVDDPGVIARSFVHIFSHIGQSSHKQFLVRSSYLGTYISFIVNDEFSPFSVLFESRNLSGRNSRLAFHQCKQTTRAS